MASSYKFGKTPRQLGARAPHHLSNLLASVKKDALPPIPTQYDWASGLPNYLGMMLNDQLGDCTCAALGHAEQVWTFNALGSMNTITDAQVQQLYTGACGYIPGNAQSDRGGNEQEVLRWTQQNGIPGAKGTIDDWVEVDARNHADICRVIFDCAVCYVGFDVPSDLMSGANPPPVWDFHGNYNFLGGHAVIAVGFNVGVDGVTIISWGTQYKMTWAFWDAYVDEAYGIVATDWVNALNQQAPSGLNIAQMVSYLNSVQKAP